VFLLKNNANHPLSISSHTRSEKLKQASLFLSIKVLEPKTNTTIANLQSVRISRTGVNMFQVLSSSTENDMDLIMVCEVMYNAGSRRVILRGRNVISNKTPEKISLYLTSTSKKKKQVILPEERMIQPMLSASYPTDMTLRLRPRIVNSKGEKEYEWSDSISPVDERVIYLRCDAKDDTSPPWVCALLRKEERRRELVDYSFDILPPLTIENLVLKSVCFHFYNTEKRKRVISVGVKKGKTTDVFYTTLNKFLSLSIEIKGYSKTKAIPLYDPKKKEEGKIKFEMRDEEGHTLVLFASVKYILPFFFFFFLT